MSDITSRVVTISELYSQGRFQIPWHQRNYSWDRAQVEELLIDIDDAAAEKRICYFLGSLLLVRKPKDLWEINDGQQRMITLSLIASWLARNAYSGKNASKAKLRRLSELMFSNYKPSIGADDFFDKLKPRIITPDEYRPSYEMLLREGGIGHAGHLKTAWETIAEHFGKRKHSAERFADYLLDKLEVSCIYIPGNVNPNSIFESINCRGRKLDDFDLIRNYLYSFFNNRNAEKEAVHQKLEQLTVRLGNKKRIAEYLDCFFQCKYGYLQHNFFYRNVKRAIEAAERAGSPKQTREKIYSLISEFAVRQLYTTEGYGFDWPLGHALLSTASHSCPPCPWGKV